MIKKIVIGSGRIIATLLMFSPIVLLVLYNYNLSNIDLIFFLICSILYDFYFFTVIKFENNKNSVKEHYYKYIKDSDKKLNLKISDKEKIKNLENYIENLINTYF